MGVFSLCDENMDIQLSSKHTRMTPIRPMCTNATLFHYENTSMQYTAIFHGCKNVHFQMNIFNIFLIFAQNIDFGYTLEPPP